MVGCLPGRDALSVAPARRRVVEHQQRPVGQPQHLPGRRLALPVRWAAGRGADGRRRRHAEPQGAVPAPPGGDGHRLSRHRRGLGGAGEGGRLVAVRGRPRPPRRPTGRRWHTGGRDRSGRGARAGAELGRGRGIPARGLGHGNTRLGARRPRRREGRAHRRGRRARPRRPRRGRGEPSHLGGRPGARRRRPHRHRCRRPGRPGHAHRRRALRRRHGLAAPAGGGDRARIRSGAALLALHPHPRPDAKFRPDRHPAAARGHRHHRSRARRRVARHRAQAQRRGSGGAAPPRADRCRQRLARDPPAGPDLLLRADPHPAGDLPLHVARLAAGGRNSRPAHPRDPARAHRRGARGKRARGHLPGESAALVAQFRIPCRPSSARSRCSSRSLPGSRSCRPGGGI